MTGAEGTAAKAPASEPTERPVVLRTEAFEVERTLGRARILLAAAVSASLWVGAAGGTPASAGVLATAAYLAFAIALLVGLRVREPGPWYAVAVQGLDLAWALVIAIAASGPYAPTLLFFAFVLVSAAVRWGLRASMAVAAGAAVVLGAAQLLGASGLAVRAVQVLILGGLLGYVGEGQQRLRAQSAVVARLMGALSGQVSMRAAMQRFTQELTEVFGAARALAVIGEAGSERAFLWDARAGDGTVRQELHLSEAPAPLRDWPQPGGTEAWLARERDGRLRVTGLDARGQRVDGPEALAGAVRETAPCRVVMASAFAAGGWRGWVMVLDPASSGARDLAFLHTLVRQAAPALENVYLIRTLRTKAGAAERARVARELHDGVIQSLMGLEMQVDVLRQQAIARSGPHVGALTHIQALLHSEVIAVRELMDQMRPIDVGPHQLLEHLAVMVDRFRRESGIEASFVCALPEVSLSPNACREVARIVQEGLVNVRRHSAARHVVVRLEREDDSWRLTLDDDGKGFGFAGRLDHAQMEEQRKGPLVIRERVRAMGGTLTIESTPDRGARLEVRIAGDRHGR